MSNEKSTSNVSGGLEEDPRMGLMRNAEDDVLQLEVDDLQGE